MNILQALTRDSEDSAHRMARMLARLSLDPETVTRELLGTRMHRILTCCRGCRNATTCERWLNSAAATGYREFCPNASLFDTLRRSSLS